MAIGTSAAILGSSLIGAGASTAGAIIGSRASNKAAGIQANAADEIRQQAKDAAISATGEVNQSTTAANKTLTDAQAKQLEALRPYIEAGTISLTDLQKVLSDSGPLGEGNKFSFSPKDWQNQPGYEFIRQQGEQAIQRQAAAGGTLFSGGTSKGLGRFTTGLAASHLDSAFQRALQEYQTNRQTTLARVQGLQGLTGLGYNATQVQDADIGNTARSVAANEIARGRYAGDTGLEASRIAAEAIGGKANAQAAGAVGSANAWNSGLGGVANAVQTGAFLYTMPQVVQPGVVGSGGFSPGITDADYTGLNARRP